MKVDQQLRFIVINHMAASLQSLIADGHYRATSLGRDSWKSLLESQSSLQLHCNREGFNSDGAIVKTRIGTMEEYAEAENDIPSLRTSYVRWFDDKANSCCQNLDAVAYIPP